jgi:hypothetical protein
LFRSKFIHGNASARRRVTAVLRLFAGAASICLNAAPAIAHGFGQRYDLPLPFSLYLIGTAAAIVVSFLIVGLFIREAPRVVPASHIDLLAYIPGRLFAAVAVPVLQLIVLALFFVAIAAGLLGDQNPYRNIVPTLVWIIFWVGLAFLSALVGNLWALISPWRTLFEYAERFCQRLANRNLSLGLRYPKALGVWPAFILLLAFCWTELVDSQSAVPAHLASLAIAYSVLTWIGMLLFDREIWLRNGEVFSVVFGLFARFAPTDMRCGAPGVGEWRLRPFGAGLIESELASPSMTALVLLILSTVLYDGLLATPEWTSLESAIHAFVPIPDESYPVIPKTIGLIVFWCIFFFAYLFVSALMSVASAGLFSSSDLARSFALTLVPIAIGYHVAHYLAFLLVQGQYLIPLLSDPFGYGWDIFGTAGYRVDIAVVGARFEWYAAVSAIVLGHIAAVYLAHAKAMQVFGRRTVALRSQVPLTALMVVYTFVSLSILAEPIVKQGTTAQPSATASHEITVPDAAVLPDAAGVQLRRVGAGKLAKAKLTYRLLGSDFHDGTKTSAADILYSYVFAYRWGTRRADDESHYDPLIEAATTPIRDHLVGLHVVGTDTNSKSFRVGDVNFIRELFVIDVYATIAPHEPDREAIVIPPWSTLPWHLVVLMEEAVGRGWAAFSQSEARRRGVEWLDLARSKETNQKLATLATEFERYGYRPESLRSLVSENEARKRWTAILAFYKAHGHFLVTNGPYQLKSWLPDSVTLEAFRDSSYPLGVGSYDAYAIPRRGFITKVEQKGDKVRLSGEIELIDKFQRSFKLVRTPLQSIPRLTLQRAAPECRYIVIDDGNRVVSSGLALLREDASFQIAFEGTLPVGSYIMFATIATNGNAMNADIRRIPIVITSKP